MQIRFLSIEGVDNGVTLRIYVPDQQKESVHRQEVNKGNQHTVITLKLKEEILRNINKTEIRVSFSTRRLIFWKREFGTVILDTKDLMLKNCTTSSGSDGGLKVQYEIYTKYPRNKSLKIKVEELVLQSHLEYKFSTNSETEYIRKFIKDYVPPNHSRTATLFYAERSAELVEQLKKLEVKGLDADNVINPETYCSSVVYLQEMNKVVDAVVTKVFEFKQNRRILENLQDELMRREAMAKRELTTGALGQEDYLKRIQEDLARDRILYQEYEARKI